MTINLRKSQLLISVFLSLIGLGFGDLEAKAQTESVSEIGSYNANNSNPEEKPNSLSQFVHDNIALVPSFYVIVNPNNFTSNGPIYVGNFRTQISF